ncbi:MAG: hypothetical protein HKN45_05765, partial [Flavobacteriales bacterium]|nr:hypothetical protein [Flavobacteriales bacterium]
MKHFYSLLTLLFLSSIAMGQIVFESNFETWSSPNEPDDWGGIKTNIQAVNVNQSTDGPTQGTYLVELINLESGHKRFTTQGISLEEGQTYEVEIWAKGDGELRTGLYDNDVDDGDFGFITYNSYEIVDTTDVYSFVQTIVPDTTYDACELILSLRNGTLLVDRVEVRIGEEVEAMPRTISEIQFTTDPDGDSPEVGVYVETSGVVTAIAGDGYYIQDGIGAWSGLRVRDFDN